MNLYTKFKTNIKYVSMALLLVTIACSDDYLTVNPYGVSIDQSFYKTPTDANQALNAAYSPLREMYGKENFTATLSNDIVFGDVGTDDFIKGGVSLANAPELLQKQNYSIITTNKNLDAIWDVNYKGILYANLVIENVPEITFDNPEEKKQILAEARYLRAYYYFDLVNSFGGVPLVDKPLEFGKYSLPRTTAQKIYEFIEDDLSIAIADLPSRFDKGSAYLGHADKGAALGLMMRVSLYQNKMDAVKTYGDQLFMMPYALIDYKDIFQPEGEWSTGSIFEINYSSNSSVLGTGLLKRIAPKSKKGGGFIQAKRDLRDAYVVSVIGTDTIRDPRYDASFYTPNDKSGTYGTGWYNRKYSWAPYSKYEYPTIGGNGNSSANNLRVIRLADAYLMYAEAVYQDDPATAIEYVNKVRKRARESGEVGNLVPADLLATLSGDALRDAIYKERRLELAGEGYRYHDLVRTGRAATVLGPLGFQTGKHEVMPIPYSQITLSQGVLLQNNY